MPIETITYKNREYLKIQTIGPASRFAIEYASNFCKGTGYDIGCMKEEWAFPGSIPIDVSLNNGYSAYKLPYLEVDYIFSSHCLEHLEDWVMALDYWTSVLKKGGVLFLYLPHPDQTYWLPWNNKKHKHIFHPHDICNYLEQKGYKNIFNSERDLYHSFMVIGEKK